MSPEEWLKQQGGGKPLSPEEWMAKQQGRTGTSAGPDYAGDVAAFRNKKVMEKPLGEQGAVGDFLSGLGHGVMAPVRGVRQAYNYATGDQKTLERLQREEEEASKKLGGWGTAGNVIGQVGTSFIPVAGQIGKAGQLGAKAAQAASKLGTTAKAAATGAGVAALDPTMSKEGQAQDYLTEKAKDVALGAGLGGAAGQVSKLFGGKLFGEAGKKASEDLGGIATPGQLISAARGAGTDAPKFGANATEWERRAGMVLPGSNILGSRDLAHEAGVAGMLAKEAAKAGVDVSQGRGFKDVYKLAQEGKAKGYADTVKQLSFGKSAEDFSKAVDTSLASHTKNLTGPVAEDVAMALRQAGVDPYNVAGKTQLGGYSGQNVQDILSTLNKEISSRFGQNATRHDNVAGEALIKIRDDMVKMAEKGSSPEAFKRFQDLNRLHQMTGPDTQTKRGVFGRAASYVNARERGAPTLRELSQAAGAGRQTKARNEIAEQAARLEDIAGKHSTTGQGELSKLFRIGANVASLGASPWTLGAQFLPYGVYNKTTLKALNKLAQEGNPEAQRRLLMMGRGAAATDVE